jgi:hypothetical protein
MILAAHSIGIGSCWICHLPRKNELRDLFKIPGHYDPIAFISLGYCDKAGGKRDRKYKVNEVLSYNEFDFPADKKGDIGLGLKRFIRGLYYNSPKIFRRIIDSLAKIFEKKFD